jgi:hypothetical protein
MDIFPPTPTLSVTLYFNTDFVVPSVFDSSNTCHRLLVDAKIIMDNELPSGSHAKLRRHLYSRARVRAIRRVIGGLNSVSCLGRAAMTIAKKRYKEPLFYSDKDDDFSTTSDLVHTEGHHLTPVTAFSAVTNPLSITREHAILDSGANVHCLNSDMPIFNARKLHTHLSNASGKKEPITAGGDMDLHLCDAYDQDLPSLPIRNALIIPDSPFNLLSIRKLIREGAEFRFCQDASYMRFSNHLFQLHLVNGLYVIDLMHPLKAIVTAKSTSPPLPPTSITGPVDDVALFAHIAPTATAETWHRRCGHVHAARLIQLHKSGRALGLQFPGKAPHNAKCDCNICMMSNNVSRSVPSTRVMPPTVSRKGQLITSDVLGPFPPSPEGHRYAISYTDEYTRYSMVYFMKAKSEAPQTFQALIDYYKFMNIVISEIRTDQGG